MIPTCCLFATSDCNPLLPHVLSSGPERVDVHVLEVATTGMRSGLFLHDDLDFGFDEHEFSQHQDQDDVPAPAPAPAQQAYHPGLGPADPKTDDSFVTAVRDHLESLPPTWKNIAVVLDEASVTLAGFAEAPVTAKGGGKGSNKRKAVEKVSCEVLQNNWRRQIKKTTGVVRGVKSATKIELTQFATTYLSSRHFIHPKHFEPSGLAAEIVEWKKGEREKKFVKQNDIKHEFCTAAQLNAFAKLESDKDQYAYLECIVGQSEATSTKKMQFLQRFLGVDDFVSHKSRFRFLTAEEAQQVDGARVWEGGKYHGEVVDGEAVKRRKLMRLQNNQDRAVASADAKKRVLDDARRLNAFRMAAERAERKAVRGYNLMKRLDMFTLLDVDIAPLANRSFAARDKFNNAHFASALGVALPKYHALKSQLPSEDDRPFICMRLGPDATDYNSGKLLASECVSARANEDYSISFVQVNPKSTPHDGGNYSLLQDLYTMLSESVPMPGAVVAEWPSDPIVAYMGSSDCGSDVLLGFRKYRDLCGGARAERRAVLHEMAPPRLGRLFPENGQAQHMLPSDPEEFQHNIGLWASFNKQQEVLAELMPDYKDSVDLTRIPLQCFFMQVICMSHQYHLLDGELIELVHDMYPDFMQKVKTVVKAQNQWGSLKVKTFAEHRWQTLQGTLDDLVKHQSQIVHDIRSLIVNEKQPELQVTAKSAQEAVEDPSLFSFCRSLQVVLAVTDACADATKKDSAEVWSDTKLEQMERATPFYRADIQAMVQNFLETQGDLDQDALAMILTLAVRLPDRQKQFFTWPLLFNRFFPEDPVEVGRAAELVLDTDYEKRDPFLTHLVATCYQELCDLADCPTTQIPWRLFKILAPIYVCNSGTAVWVEGAHSRINNFRKNAPSMKMEKAGVLHVLGNEKKLAFDEWQEVQAQWKAMYDRRTKTGKQNTREEAHLKKTISARFGIVDQPGKPKNAGAARALRAGEVVVVEPSDAEANESVAPMEVVEDEEEPDDWFGDEVELNENGVMLAVPNVGPQHDDEDEDLLEDEELAAHPLLERALIMWDDHHQTVLDEEGSIGGKLGQHGALEVPHNVAVEAQVPTVSKKFPGKKTVLAEQGGAHAIGLMSLIQKLPPAPEPTKTTAAATAKAKKAAAKKAAGKKGGFDLAMAKAALKKPPASRAVVKAAEEEWEAEEPVYICFYKSKKKGYLLRCTEVPTDMQNLGRQVAPLQYSGYAVNLENPRSISAWATRPAITTKTPLRFRENSSCRFIFSKRWGTMVAVASRGAWVERTVPRGNLVVESKRKEFQEDVVERNGTAGGTRTRRDFEWKSIDQLAAVPELRLSERLRRLSVNKKLYAIFRPETSTWTATIKLKTRKVSHSGTPLDHDQSKRIFKKYSADLNQNH
eukprot:g11844.t1